MGTLVHTREPRRRHLNDISVIDCLLRVHGEVSMLKKGGDFGDQVAESLPERRFAS